MSHETKSYILPDWVLTMDDYRKHQRNHSGLPSAQSEPPPREQLEIEHRMAKIAADKAAKGYIENEYNQSEVRHSHAIHRCRGNGSRRGGFGVSRD